ncbi:MAG: XRE family transcriptional regulator [Alphaproteobacteria bacterium]
MTTTLKQRMEQLPAKRRAKVETRAHELIAEEMTLCDLRRALDLTQQRMAETLDIGQDSVSRLEKRSDLLLSTLRSYVAAMGGSLELVARFPDRPPVIVSGLTRLDGADKPGKRKAARSDGRRAKRPSTA